MTDPQPNRAFEWTQVAWGRVLRCVPLSAAAGHFFTANELTLRDSQDDWTAVATAAGVPLDDLLLIRQVHDATVAVAARDRIPPWHRPEADAIITNDSTAAIAVRVADCVPILLADETGRHVAAVHAGWRGTAKRVVIAAVSAMQARYGVRPERLIAAVGPSIGPCCYEVGESTREVFRQTGHHSTILDRWFSSRGAGKFHLDLWQATRDELEGAGLNPDTIHVAELCTKPHEGTHTGRFHSYRVSGEHAGRMAAVIRAGD